MMTCPDLCGLGCRFQPGIFIIYTIKIEDELSVSSSTVAPGQRPLIGRSVA